MKFAYKKNVFESIASNFDYLFQRVNDAFLHVNPRSFIDIATVEDENTIVMRNGTLLTAIKINGSSRDVLYDEYVEILDILESSFRSYFVSGEHYFSFTFKSDPESVDEQISRMWTNSALSVAKKLDLDMDDIIQEIHDVHKEYCQNESAYLLVWTNVNSLTKQERALQATEKSKFMQGVPRHEEAQKIAYTGRGFYEKHRAVCEQIIKDFQVVSIQTEIESARDFIRELRINIDETFTSNNWSPRLPGDKISLNLPADNDADFSTMFQTSIPEQLINRTFESMGEGIARSGDILYAPLSLEQHPMEPTPFDVLFKNIHSLKIPFRMHMLLQSNGMRVFNLKVQLARMLSFMKSEKNQRLIESSENLFELKKTGEEIISSQILFCTWCRDVNDLDEMRRRKHSLAKALSGWGSCQVAQAEGDEVESTLSSIGGTTLGSVGEAAAAPLYDAIKMAPIARPSSAWLSGSKLYRSETGKLLPYLPYSKQQTAWVKLILGPMGAGKSVHLNGEHFSLLLHPDNDELPFIYNIDIGPGMKGFCAMVRDALPKHKKHLVLYEKLQNRTDKAINSFDTPLGLRYPLSSHRAYLETFLEMLCASDSTGIAPEGVLGVLSKLVDLIYKHRAERESARIYSEGISPRVDEVLGELNFFDHDFNGRKVTWWDVVDFLSMKSQYHVATIAQRYASPTIEDAASRVIDPRILQSSKDTLVGESSENVCQYVRRKLTEAIDRYPIISGFTQFDIGESRIVSLDLDEVAKGVGTSSQRKLSLMYFLAYSALTKRIFIGKDGLEEMRNDESGLFQFDYLPYHRELVAQVEKSPKRFSGDEIHRFAGDPMAKKLQILSIREGRKAKLDVLFASQTSDEYDDTMLKLATDIVILGRGNRSNVEAISKHLNLPENLTARLGSTSMRRPSKAGSTIVMMVETEKARYEQFVISTYGPSFLWATTSTRDDTIVKDKLTVKLGSDKARKLLVKLYPAGNLDREIEDRRKRAAIIQEQSVAESSADVDKKYETPAFILDDIVEDALVYFEKHVA